LITYLSTSFEKEKKREKSTERENQPFSIMSQSTASFPSTTAATAAASKSTSSMVPQSKLASAAAITESAPEAKDTNTTSTTEDFVPLQLARRSSHNYEHDSAEFFSGPRHTAENRDEVAIPKFHTRRESFNREDQKRMGYAHLYLSNEEKKKKGFSEVA